MHKVIEVNGKKYHYGQVSAEQQLELYEEIGARLLANCVGAKCTNVDVNVLKGLSISSPKGTIKYIASIVLEKCFADGAEEPVTIDDFQGNIDNFVLLVCHGLEVNLSDFFSSIEIQVMELVESLKQEQEKLL